MKKNKQCSLCLESISLIDGCLGQPKLPCLYLHTVIYIDSSMNGDTIYQKKDWSVNSAFISVNILTYSIVYYLSEVTLICGTENPRLNLITSVSPKPSFVTQVLLLKNNANAHLNIEQNVVCSLCCPLTSKTEM